MPEDSVDLLELGLKFIDPNIITDKRAKNKHGPPEKSIQASLFMDLLNIEIKDLNLAIK